jgi:benzoyl-CoA reductase subunit D
MITAGIDMGAKTIKVLLLKDSEVLAKGLTIAGFEEKEDAKRLFNEVLQQAKIKREDIEHIVATGAGREVAPYADDQITDVGADARGAVFLFPSARTVIDVGAEEGRGIKCDEMGRVKDFAVNEKCAAGSGTFTEAMARALEMPLEDFGRIALKATKAIPMNAQCAVFAESEVVSLIHAKTLREDISRAVHDAIAERIISMVRRVGLEKDVVLIGGVALNPGFVDAVKRGLGMDVLVPEAPEYVGALGAAVAAAKGVYAVEVTGKFVAKPE